MTLTNIVWSLKRQHTSCDNKNLNVESVIKLPKKKRKRKNKRRKKEIDKVRENCPGPN